MAKEVEGAREWETLKYDSLLIGNTIINDPERLIPRDSLASCPDSALTAFAQLCVLRLNASRALISLFDRQYQYIVAEATPSGTLSPNHKCNDDNLWLCGTAVPRAFGVCDHVLARASAPDSPDESMKWSPDGTLPISVIPNLQSDARFCGRSFVRDTPHHRFYAGVPIRTPKGFHIGVLCVFDDKPRETLEPSSLQVMADLSFTIMDYLESRRANSSYLRSERMVLGLGNFIQGKDDPSTWWAKRAKPSSRARGSRPTVEVVDGGAFQVHDEPQEPTRPCIRPVVKDTLAAAAVDKLGSSDSVETQSTTASSSVIPVDPHKVETDKIFTRAADIIRESLDVDGAIFLDASIGSFGGLVGSPHKGHPDSSDDPASSSEDSSSGQSKTSDERPCKTFGVSRIDKTDRGHDKPELDSAVVTERFLRKLLRRYPNGKIFSFDDAGAWYSGESSGDDTDTVPTENEDDADDDEPKSVKAFESPYSRRNEAKTIGLLFPGARSIALVPLWDPYRDRWHAGGFVWSKTSTRILTTDADLPYLRAFGMVTMAEVTRLDAMVADKAKTDILGSLSHELRSPLHGVVAAAELLHDTQLDAFQIDVVHTIEISGKTLLDTIDHLLAYSKVNTFLRASKKAQHKNKINNRGLRQGTEASIESGMMSLVSDVAIDVLAEEVIETVFIGHSFQHMVASQLARHGASGSMTAAQERLDTIYSAEMGNPGIADPDLPTNLGDVLVIIDIDPHRSWTFQTQPGAIRRIIMNLFGNALKYTSRGHIKISLKQEPLSHRTPKTLSKVVLTVSDTGKGISEDFLRNKLFTPFSQEDHLAPGTGLGLSLVRQIVASLGGSISVKSHAGQGTAVTVSFPLAFSQSQAESKGRSPRFSFDSRALHSTRASAVGFGEAPEFLKGDSIEMNGTMPLESLPLKWYSMRLCEPAPDPDEVSPDADVAIYTETAFYKLDESALRDQKVPGVVICHNAATAIKLDGAHREKFNGVFEFVPQPNTPRKFGKALSCSLNRWKEQKARRTEHFVSPPTRSPTLNGNDHIKLDTTTFSYNAAPGQNGNGNGNGSRATSPHSKRMPTMTCRLWDLDVDPDCPSPRPRRRHSNVVISPVEAISNGAGGMNWTNGVNGTTAVNGAQDTNGVGSPPAITEVNGVNGESEAVEHTAQDQLKFLVVDDNPLNLKLLCTFLKRMKRDHCTAVNGFEAVEVYKQNPDKICCILMDINMPVMDGLESTRQIRQFERHSQRDPVTIIAITGLGSRSAQEEAFASGLDLFLTRPVKLGELFTILKERGLWEGEPHVITNGWTHEGKNGEVNGEVRETNGQTNGVTA